MTTPTTTRLEEIQSRVDAARERSKQTLRDLPESHLLSRAESDRQVLARHAQTLITAFINVAELHKPVQTRSWTEPQGWHDVEACDTCRVAWPCETYRIITDLDRKG